MIEFLKPNRKPLRFLALFGLIFGTCYLLLGVVPRVQMGVINLYTEFLAGTVAAVINLFGAGAVANGALVSSPRYSMDIAMGCDGVEASCLYLAGVGGVPYLVASQADRISVRSPADPGYQPDAPRGTLLCWYVFAVRSRPNP